MKIDKDAIVPVLAIILLVVAMMIFVVWAAYDVRVAQ